MVKPIHINLSTEFHLQFIDDLQQLKKIFQGTNMKPNYAELARQLDKDPRTIKKYYENDITNTPVKRYRKSKLDCYYDILVCILSRYTTTTVFYKSNIAAFLRDFCNDPSIKDVTVRNYFAKRPALNSLFKFQKSSHNHDKSFDFESVEQERTLIVKNLGTSEMHSLEQFNSQVDSGNLFSAQQLQDAAKETGDVDEVVNEYFYSQQSANDCNGLNIEATTNVEEKLKEDLNYDKTINQNVYNKAFLRVETPPGVQAQFDWKEEMKITLLDGETVTFNVGLLLLSYSRFKYVFVSFDRTQQSMFDFLTNVFEDLGGAPKHIVIDNMKTIMDKARTQSFPGVINKKAQDFAKDFNFEFKPCVAYSPQTKGKVENPMKLFDAIYTYNGMLSFGELIDLIYFIVFKANLSVCQATNYIPSMLLNQEKANITSSLPSLNARSKYKFTTNEAKVLTDSMFSYKSNYYSVPQQYIDKKINYKVVNTKLHIYYSNKLIACHEIMDGKAKKIQNRTHFKNFERYNEHWKSKTDTVKKTNIQELGDIYG